jgi:hypothetical protein
MLTMRSYRPAGPTASERPRRRAAILFYIILFYHPFSFYSRRRI